MGSAIMANRKGIHISGHYVVSINVMPFQGCTLNSNKLKVGQNHILYCL